MPRRQISLAAFGVAAVAFFLPFVTLSCAGRPLVTATGIQLATRHVNATPTDGPLGARADPDTALSLLVLVAFACSVLGILASRRGRRTVLACAGGTGAGSLLLFSSALSAHVRQRANGLFTLEYERGFYLALLGLIAAVILNVVAAKEDG
jgi:hypothetical protein